MLIFILFLNCVNLYFSSNRWIVLIFIEKKDEIPMKDVFLQSQFFSEIDLDFFMKKSFLAEDNVKSIQYPYLSTNITKNPCYYVCASKG